MDVWSEMDGNDWLVWLCVCVCMMNVYMYEDVGCKLGVGCVHVYVYV